ncbi:MAG: glycine cleavage system protein GcvH [Venatoribacter sp.]
MSNIPADLKYVDSHEWIREEADGTVTIGITDFAQAQLGDVVFVELPEVGMEVAVGQEVAVVESVKAASDIYAPLSGKVVAINEELVDAPELANDDPYGKAWFFKLELSNKDELNNLLDAAGYQAACE